MSFRCVALVQIVPVVRVSFTNVVKLLSCGNESSVRVILVQAVSTETEPSEKYISRSDVQAVIVSQSRYTTQEAVAVKISSSGL